jgi:hypothetical protein
MIPDPDPDFLPAPDPGVKKAPDPGSATLILLARDAQINTVALQVVKLVKIAYISRPLLWGGRASLPLVITVPVLPAFAAAKVGSITYSLPPSPPPHPYIPFYRTI